MKQKNKTRQVSFCARDYIYGVIKKNDYEFELIGQRMRKTCFVVIKDFFFDKKSNSIKSSFVESLFKEITIELIPFKAHVLY